MTSFYRSEPYKPNQKAPFRLSRSKIELFMQCQRCFWLDVRLKITRPSSPPFNINKAIDELFKKEFDIYRSKGKPHPLMAEKGIKAVPFQHPHLDKWRRALGNDAGIDTVHKTSNLHIYGAIDDVWVDDDGNIIAVNYQSAKEKILLAAAIKADKSQLPASLQKFKKPVYLIFTKNYKIRIDETADGVYRYAAWKIKSRKTLPDIVIENGTWEFQGSGGNHTVTFTNNGYTYIVSVFVINAADEPDASIEVIQQEKAILTEDGRIIRN